MAIPGRLKVAVLMRWIPVLFTVMLLACVNENSDTSEKGPTQQTEACAVIHKEPMADRLCTQQYDPVCGCDGKTYPNACTAGTKGVNIRRAGACEDASSPDLAAAATPTQLRLP